MKYVLVTSTNLFSQTDNRLFAEKMSLVGSLICVCAILSMSLCEEECPRNHVCDCEVLSKGIAALDVDCSGESLQRIPDLSVRLLDFHNTF